MIVRAEHDSFVLITQPEHAALSGRIMAAWQTDGLRSHIRRQTILLATREHDIGWQPVDRRPTVDLATGHPHHFLAAPDSTKREIWPSGVAQLKPRNTAAAALVAQHALTVLDRRPSAAWQHFFSTMEAERNRIVSAGAFDGNHDTLLADYRFVLLGDFLSLVFCCGWRQTFHRGGYDITLHTDHLVIQPDPFGGREIKLEVAARRIPTRRYVSDDDLRHTFGRAPQIVICGHASGP